VKPRIVRRIRGGGSNPWKRSLCIILMALLSLFKDLVEILSMGTYTSDLYEKALWSSDLFERLWWQGEGGFDERTVK
jgi:hypothetical protein